MNTKINKLKKSLLDMQPKVVKVTKTDYTLDNGDVYEHTFDIDENITVFEYCSKHGYKVEYIIKDMGSGLNDKRKGFVKLCNLVAGHKIDKVVIEHKDRLTRFQYNLIEFFFNSYGVDIELVDSKDYTEQEELVNDMMMLIASFSGKVYSLRAQENRKKRKEQKQ